MLFDPSRDTCQRILQHSEMIAIIFHNTRPQVFHDVRGVEAVTSTRRFGSHHSQHTSQQSSHLSQDVSPTTHHPVPCGSCETLLPLVDRTCSLSSHASRICQA